MASVIRRLLIVVAAAFALSPLAAQAAAPAKTEQAVFSGGCFWCMEYDMKAIPGVISVESGYTGGHVKKPTYADVTSETSGHYESVRVTYDPAKISYKQLLDRYWKLVDPTDDGGQFCDRGPSYRPAVWVANAQQRAIAEKSRAEAAKKLVNGEMKEQILPLQTFYPAEEYHRNYAVRHAAAYQQYRQGCGRDRRLALVWGVGG
jgi:peptide-methionine (S)-S-oxide reductase